MFKLARFISNIFNPLVVVVFIATGVIYHQTGNTSYSLKWFLLAALASLVFSGFIILGIRRKIFSNFDVSKQKQRPLLFSAALLFILTIMALMYFTNSAAHLLLPLVLSLVGILAYAIVNTKIKASVHIGVLTVFVVLFIYMFGKIFLPAVVLIPIVSWARVREKEHTIPEVIVGFIIGLVFSIPFLFLLQ